MAYTDIQVLDWPYGDEAWQTGTWYLPRAGGNILPNRPGIVAIHGGGWGGGTKDDSWVVSVCMELAKKGYHVYSMNYLLVSEATIIAADGDSLLKKMVNDVNLATSYVRGVNCTDSARICTLGWSAGGHLAFQHSVADNLPQAGQPNCVIGVEPVVDLRPWAVFSPELVQALLGNEMLIEEASPILSTNIAPPSLILCGNYWLAISPDDAANYTKKLTNDDVAAGWINFEDAFGHGLPTMPQTVATLVQVWIDRLSDVP